MQVSKIPLVLGLPLFLGACATAVPGIYTEPKAGFANISSQVTPAIGKRTAFAETQAENEALKKQVHSMVHRKTISADTAVQVALLNNRLYPPEYILQDDDEISGHWVPGSSTVVHLYMYLN